MAAGAPDVLVVSLGSTGGLRAADQELLDSLRRAGATAQLIRAEPPKPVRTLMLTDLAWARATRRALQSDPAVRRARAVIYSTTTAALLWLRPGAIRFDAPAAANRPGRHGLWQRPLERRRLGEAPLLLPQSEGALLELTSTPASARTLVLPVPVEPSQNPLGSSLAPDATAPSIPRPARDIAVLSYVANPLKKGLDRMLGAWETARREGECMVLVGCSEEHLRELGYRLPPGASAQASLPPDHYRALLRRARVYVCAARREDYGIAQLEALADGCMLVSVPSPGPYVALPIARELDERLVGEDLARALRTALDEPRPGYAEQALQAIAPWRRAAVDRIVAEQLLERLLGAGKSTDPVR